MLTLTNLTSYHHILGTTAGSSTAFVGTGIFPIDSILKSRCSMIMQSIRKIRCTVWLINYLPALESSLSLSLSLSLSPPPMKMKRMARTLHEAIETQLPGGIGRGDI